LIFLLLNLFRLKKNFQRALLKPLHGDIEVRFVSIPTLIRMKQLADRPQDHIDIEYLRRIEDEANG